MATTYTWLIQELKAKVQDEESGLENVITMIHWRYRGEAGDHSHELYGSMGLDTPDPEAFVQWEALKYDKAQIIDWLEAGLDVESLQSNIQKVLELKAQPKEITLYLEQPIPGE
jgi:hypothetical protein